MAQPILVMWNEETILEHLKKIAREQLNLTPEQIDAIGPDASLMDALQLDSLAQVVLVTTIEQDFGCAFGLDQWQQLETVQDLVRMIAGRACEQEPRA
jgi:acyl carrier protein